VVSGRKWTQSEAEVKVVTKPWGNATIDGVAGVGELWLNYKRGENVGEEEKRYVLKKLYIRKGTRTSFQCHSSKLETNHLISGLAEAWQENENGEIEKVIVKPGDTWTIPCGRKHRLIALEDVIMIEASTPEVDDVTRIADDSNRPDGRVDSEHASSSRA